MPTKTKTQVDAGNRSHAQSLTQSKSASTIRPRAIISTKNLSFEIDGKTLLHSVNLEIRAQEINTIIGPNGAGKTTLLRLLLGLLTPSTGTIIRTPNLKVGYVPQKFNLDKTIPMTVARFISLKDDASRKEALDALAKVDADILLDRQVAELSGGEFQRVVLARAIINEPDLLILDEPVQGVDYAGEAELYRLIENIRDTIGCAIVLVSHDLHVVMAASDHIICLNQHVCCSGVPEKVAKDPEYRRLFGSDTAGAFALYHHEHDHHHNISGEISDCGHDHNHDHNHDRDHDADHTSSDDHKDSAK